MARDHANWGTSVRGFGYHDNELYCEDVPAARIAAEFGTPVWIYSKNELGGAVPRDPRGVCSARTGHLLFGQGERKPGDFESDARGGQQLRHRLGGRAVPRQAGRGRLAPRRLCRRREDRRRDPLRARVGHFDVQRGERGRARRHFASRFFTWPPCFGGPAAQSRHRRQNPREDDDGQAGQQVRHGYRAGVAIGREGPQRTAIGVVRHPHAPRFADPFDRAVFGCRSKGRGALRPISAAAATR